MSIPNLTKHAWRVFTVLIALAIVAIALLVIPAQAGAAPSARCVPGSLMTTQTTPVHYLRCAKNGLWYGISERTYRKLLAARLLVQR